MNPKSQARISSAIYWKVDPEPTGRYRSFQSRRWPTAYYKGSNKPAFFLECADDYDPQVLKTGLYAPVYIIVCHHNHPKAGNSWARLRLRAPFKTLAEAKEVCLALLRDKPEIAPAVTVDLG